MTTGLGGSVSGRVRRDSCGALLLLILLVVAVANWGGDSHCVYTIDASLRFESLDAARPARKQHEAPWCNAQCVSPFGGSKWGWVALFHVSYATCVLYLQNVPAWYYFTVTPGCR